MRRGVWGAALALSVGVWVASAGAARASCDQLRADIVTMDAKSSGEPGYLALRAELTALYDKLCRGGTGRADPQYWYDRDGNPLGPATDARPAAAAYATTAAIARACATAINPSRCVLARGAVSMCAAPPDAETKADCEVIASGYPADGDTVLGTAPPLPPAALTLGGRRFALAPACLDALAASADDGDDTSADPRKRQMGLDTLRQACGPVLAALEQLLGAAAASDPGRFWPALSQRATTGFGAPGAVGASRMPAEFCRQAEVNMNTCRARQESMGTFGSTPHNSSGQAGAFGDCYKIYSAAFGMCRMTDRRAAARAPAGPTMSPQCQAVVQRYIAAAQAHDGPQAVADYNALKQLGGCGVLDKVDPSPPTAVAGPSVDDPRFKSRGATPLSDQVIGGCDAAPDVCAAYVQQLRAGVSPEAQAAIVNNAIGVGLALGGMMANGMSLAAPRGGGTYSIGGGPNMNSIGNRPVRSTYGQGSPTGPPPPPPQYGGNCPGGGPCATTAR